MWFIFPQIDGLEYSFTAKFYAIKSKGEAQAYLNHWAFGGSLVSGEVRLVQRDRQPMTTS